MMFDLKRLRNLVPEALPVPEKAVNAAMPYLVEKVPEVERAHVTVHDGHFDVDARVRKGVAVDVRVRFAVEAVRLDVTEQTIRLRRLANGDGGFTARLADLVVRAIMAAATHATDAGQVTGVRVEGDLVTVDVGALGLEALLAKYPKVKPMLRFGRIDEIRCVPGRFELVPRLAF